MTRANVLWLAGLVLVGATAGAYAVWFKQAPPAPEPPAPTLPISGTPAPTHTYYCTGARSFTATFTTSPTTHEGQAELALSDGRTFTLPQAVSGSGMRYEDTNTRYGTDVAFIGKGDNGFITENGEATYADCTAAWVEDSDAPGYALYTDIGSTFTFAFPQSFSVVGAAVGLAPGWAAGEKSGGLVLAKLAVPQSYASGTNFVDATFTVGTSADPAAVTNCLKGPAGATATPTKLGDMAVTALTENGAAAGNRYDTTSYRVLHNSQCYAIEYTIHYGAIENFEAGTVKEFDEQKVAAALDEVARSFQFLK